MFTPLAELKYERMSLYFFNLNDSFTVLVDITILLISENIRMVSLGLRLSST